MMMVLPSLCTQLVHAVMMLGAAPLLVGFVRWLKARLAGRLGPPPAQPWRDLIRLSRKQPIVAENASVLFRLAPAASFASVAAAALLVPSFALGMLLSPLADLIVIAGLLAVARCILVLAAMDLGTALGGLGASRATTLAVLAAPALMLVVLTLSLLAGTSNLDAIAAQAHDGALGLRASSGLALVAVALVAIGESGRMPVANPDGQRELALVHRALALEYGGRDLALIEGMAALQLLTWLGLISAVFLPFGLAPPQAGPLAWIIGLASWALKIAALGAALAVFESLAGDLGAFQAESFLALAGLLALLAAVLLFATAGFV